MTDLAVNTLAALLMFGAAALAALVVTLCGANKRVSDELARYEMDEQMREMSQ